jgi:hypothetical protein
MDEARELFHRVLAIKPDACITLFQLTGCQRYDDLDHEDARRIKKLLKARHLPEQDIILLHFALGKIYDDCGAFEKAFTSYRRGNALRHKGSKYDAGAFARYVDRVTGTFTRELLDELSPHSSTSELPAYIIGMPRSGTTLLEQILAGHPLVHGAGELLLVDQAIDHLRTRAGTGEEYPECISRVSAAAIAEEARGYEAFLRGLAADGVTRVIDKMPYNFKCIGLIALLFSRARFIHCTRDPLDVCLSNYFQLFFGSHDHIYSLVDLGHYYRQYERLMAHWRELLGPSRLYEVSYEDVVANSEGEARRLVEFLDLQWDEGCVHRKGGERVVHTVSTWQVRQPIYTNSVKRWENYARFLGPLRNALAESAA